MEARELRDLVFGWELVTSLPAIVLIAIAASRMLGIRRPWTTSVASGLAGWLAGACLAVAIARAEGEAGFTRNLWLFSTFFTMSAAAWIELLA
jgi:hypothetical protein